MVLLVYCGFLNMPKGTNYLISARLPKSVVDFMDLEIKEDKYLNRSDWVQCACREYMRIRQEMRKAETDSGPQGGGGVNQ